MLISILALGSFFALILGLIKPSLVRMPNRKKAFAVFLLSGMFFSVVGSRLYPVPVKNEKTSVIKTGVAQDEPKATKFDYAELSLKDYREKPKTSRHEIVGNYTDVKKIPKSSEDDIYACLSEFSFTKSDDLKLSEVLEWCFAEFQRSPDSLKKRVNLDAFQGNFSGWDGSYRPLEKFIKEHMNDDDSYKHVSTMYHLILNKDPHARVTTVYRGKNMYGAVVKEQITARVNLKTGEIESIIN